MQILLAAVGAVNGIVSSFFASNFVGTDAMSAVGLYSPLNMLVSSVSAILVGGSVILCGKYMGQNRQDRMKNVFSLNLVLTFLIAAAFTILFLIMGLFGITGFFTKDEAVRPLFNSYLIGQSVGILGSLLQKMRLRLVLRTAPPRLLTKAGLTPSDPSAGRTARGFESLPSEAIKSTP